MTQLPKWLRIGSTYYATAAAADPLTPGKRLRIGRVVDDTAASLRSIAVYIDVVDMLPVGHPLREQLEAIQRDTAALQASVEALGAAARAS